MWDRIHNQPPEAAVKNFKIFKELEFLFNKDAGLEVCIFKSTIKIPAITGPNGDPIAASSF